ncbi:MAG: response regulator transcription factor [Aggregatilineales bacterium]
MTSAPIRLLIADDHPVVREGIASIFAGHDRFQVVGLAADGAQAVALAAELQPDVILLDLRMPLLDGLGAIERMKRVHPAGRILVLTSYSSDQEVRAALRAGAVGYLLKDAPLETLFDAVLAAARGTTTLSPAVYATMLNEQQAPRDALSEREIAVLALAAEGLTNKQIGQRLHISEATVKTHLKHSYAKLNVADRAAAVAMAIKRGIIRNDDDR